MTIRSRVGSARRRGTLAVTALRGQNVSAAGAATEDGDPDGSRLPGPETTSQRSTMLKAVRMATLRDQADFHNIRRLLAFSLAPDSNCIDVGANRGTILAEMQRVAPHGRHIAFEPLPHLSTLLNKTFTGVEVHEAALSNRAGTADFAYVHGISEGWSGLVFRPLPTGEEAEVEHIKVQLEVLDEVLEPSYRPSVIKVDVEGAEEQVFEGAMQTIIRHRPIIIFEHGWGSANAYGTEPGDIYRLLCGEAGLRIFDLDGCGPYTVDDFQRTYQTGARVNFVSRP